MKRIQYILFRVLQGIVGYIPIKLLYPFSDACAFIIQDIIRYRRKVVYENLRHSFPEKSNNERKRIARLFYHNLCDVTLESIKGYSISTKEILKRYKCINPEVANEYFDKGQSVVFALSHYANWEWGTQVANTIFLHNIISIYKPLSNKFIDKYICYQREKRGMILCSSRQIKFIFRSADLIPRAYCMICDQSPSSVMKEYWVNFLNQDTACIRGIETYARLFNLPIIYLDVQRGSRGYYTITLKEICEAPKGAKNGEITELYMKTLEGIVLKKPEDWLWSHRRWKRKRSVNVLVDFRENCINSI